MSNIRKLLAKCSIETNNNANKIIFDPNNFQHTIQQYPSFIKQQALTAHHLSIYFLDTCMSDGTDFINCKKELPEVNTGYNENTEIYKEYLNNYLKQTFNCVEKLHVSD